MRVVRGYTTRGPCRQGMHELASLVFGQRANDANAAGAAAGAADHHHVWGKGGEAPSDAVREDAPELAAAYVEHDTYAMFSSLMVRGLARGAGRMHSVHPQT